MSRSVVVLLALFVVPAVAQDERKVAEGIVERAITAAGGEKNLNGLAAHTLKVKGKVEILNQSIEVAGEWQLRGVDRYRWESEFTLQGQTQRSTLLGHAEKAWIIGNNGQPNELPKEIGAALLANARALRFAQNPTLLRDKALKLEPLGKLKQDGRELVILKVVCKGYPDVDLFLDDKTGLVAKCELRMVDVKDGQEVTHTLLFDDHKEAGGLKPFGRVRFQLDGSTALDLEASEVKAQETLDDTVFAKP
jgi:hypothetical protein